MNSQFCCKYALILRSFLVYFSAIFIKFHILLSSNVSKLKGMFKIHIRPVFRDLNTYNSSNSRKKEMKETECIILFVNFITTKSCPRLWNYFIK